MGNNEETKEIKFIGLWTPEYLAKDLLFPKPVDIQVATTKLKAWAHDVVFINQSAANSEIERLKTEMQSWKDENFDNVESASETIKNLEQKNNALQERANGLEKAFEIYLGYKLLPTKIGNELAYAALTKYKNGAKEVDTKNTIGDDYRIELHE